jgi:rhodanese-related sulfurtransferase
VTAVKNIDSSELSRMQHSGALVLVDVRTDAEVARGVIAGARHIPLHLLPLRCSDFEPGVPMVIYCQSGGRSAQACAWLADKGFEPLYNLQGGLSAWLREGRPVSLPA